MDVWLAFLTAKAIAQKTALKTQIFKYFWVFSIDLCTKVLVIDFKILTPIWPQARHPQIQ
jgi:hypothetical protein